MIDTLVVVNLGKFLPSDVENVSSSLPLSILLTQTLDDHRDGHRWVLEEQIKHLFASITVNSNDGVPVDSTQSTPVERVLEFLASKSRSISTILLLCRGEEFRGDQFLGIELSNLLGNRFKTEEGSGVTVNAHINLEALIFDAEKKLLVLILSHVAEGVGLLGTDGEGYPNIIQDLLLHYAALAAGRSGIVPRKCTVAGTAPAAATEVNLRQRDGVPGIVAEGATRNAGVG